MDKDANWSKDGEVCPECGSDNVFGDVNGEPDRFDFICGFCAYEWNKEMSYE